MRAHQCSPIAKTNVHVWCRKGKNVILHRQSLDTFYPLTMDACEHVRQKSACQLCGLWKMSCKSALRATRFGQLFRHSRPYGHAFECQKNFRSVDKWLIIFLLLADFFNEKNFQKNHLANWQRNQKLYLISSFMKTISLIFLSERYNSPFGPP